VRLLNDIYILSIERQCALTKQVEARPELAHDRVLHGHTAGEAGSSKGRRRRRSSSSRRGRRRRADELNRARIL